VIALLIVGCSLAQGPLGGTLRQENFSFRPPRSFHRAPNLWFHNSKGFSVYGHEKSHFSALLTDDDDHMSEEVSTLSLSLLEVPLPSYLQGVNGLELAVAKHFKDRLKLDFSLERAERKNNRIEVFGAARFGSQLRRIVVAVFPHEKRSLIWVASVPVARWDVLRNALEASLDSVELDPVPETLGRRGGVMLALATMVFLSASVVLWWYRVVSQRNRTDFRS
jgi:hypothetical protein